MVNRLTLLAFLLLGSLSPLFATQAADSMEANRLVEQQILEELSYFAADSMEGRDTGSEQLVECANYLRSELQKLGYTFPANEDDGYQEFSIAGQPGQGPANNLQVTGAADLQWQNDRDFRVCAFGGSGAFAGPLVFCGYGIDDAENNFDEFAGLDLEGKVAVIMRRVPGQSNPGSLYVDKNGTIDVNRAGLRTKYTNARERGAVAVLFVNDPHSVKKEKDELFEFGYGGSGKPDEIPIFQITVAAANQLLKSTIGHTLEDVETAIDRTMQPLSQELHGVSIRGTADLDFSKTQTGNVVAVLEPRDADIRETIIIGAHYDHVGWGKFGSLAPGTRAIHNGADDNASGSIALLSLARRLAEKSGKLDRRIVLIWFAAEERGLLGSKHYVDAPLYPLSDTIAMLNLDMVGRMCDEKLTVFGVGSSDVWNPWLDQIEADTELNFFREKKAFGPSDHAPFYEKKIPVLHLFTGLHGDYHRPTDDVEEINVQGMRRVVDVLEGLTLNLANADQRPNYIENKKWIQVGRHAGGRPFVGVIPDLYASVDGLVVQNTAEDSPVETAGLQPGDVIVSADGQAIRTRKDFWDVIDQHAPKETIPLEFQRDGTRMSVEIKLGSPR